MHALKGVKTSPLYRCLQALVRPALAAVLLSSLYLLSLCATRRSVLCPRPRQRLLANPVLLLPLLLSIALLLAAAEWRSESERRAFRTFQIFPLLIQLKTSILPGMRSEMLLLGARLWERSKTRGCALWLRRGLRLRIAPRPPPPLQSLSAVAVCSRRPRSGRQAGTQSN